MRSLGLGLVLVLAAACFAEPSPAPSREPLPLPDLLGDEASDGTPSGMSAPVPPAVQMTETDRQVVDSLRRDADTQAGAAEKLADIYITGLKLERDLKQASQLLRDAIRLKSTTASNKLGVLLANGGPGFLRDPVEALERLREGAAFGDPKALYNLGQQYRSGDLVERDEAEAYRLFRAAMDAKNYPPVYDAFTNAAIMKMEGLGTPRDAAGAVAAWKEAAVHDNVRAAYFLGLAYARAQGVARNLDEARKWLQRSRAGGYAPAVAALERVDHL